jgi:cell division protein FtsB
VTRKSRWILWGLIGVVLLIFSGSLVLGREGLVRYVELLRKLKRTQREIVLAREQNAALKRRLEALQKRDSLAMEEEARRNHLVGQNEEIYEVEIK